MTRTVNNTNLAHPSVERRNARERNRVKQVNNTFEKLRQFIPDKIVETEVCRGASKRLSKVDTLKLAIKYIERMKEMLNENNNQLSSSSSSSASSYYSASPAPSDCSSYGQCSVSPPVSPVPSYCSSDSFYHPHMTMTVKQEIPAMNTFDEGDSGVFEEENILDDILEWQMHQ